MVDEINLDYDTIRKHGTGDHDLLDESRTIEVHFGKYIIKVIISSNNEFLGVEEVIVNKDFLSYQQRLTALQSIGYHDVEQYYQGEEEE